MRTDELVQRAQALQAQGLAGTLAKYFDHKHATDNGRAPTQGQGLRVIYNAELYPIAGEGTATLSHQALAAQHLDAPPDGSRQNRILLLVHGTFSNSDNLLHNFYPAHADSCEGPGCQFLLQCQAHYRAIIAFTHYTRSVTPDKNATLLADLLSQLLQSLASSEPWAREAPTIDIICHSRGGLVVRSLLENDAADRPPFWSQVRNVIFVATPNAGTNLAMPAHWGHVIGALAELFTRGRAEKETYIEGILTMLAHEDHEEWPGVLAMQPGGEWLKRHLDGKQRPPHTRYYAVSGNYEPAHLHWFRAPVDLLFDKVFLVANDLVVDTESVTGETVMVREERRVGRRLDLAGVMLITDGKNAQTVDLAMTLRASKIPSVELIPLEGIDHSGYFRTQEFVRFVSNILGVA